MINNNKKYCSLPRTMLNIHNYRYYILCIYSLNKNKQYLHKTTNTMNF